MNLVHGGTFTVSDGKRKMKHLTKYQAFYLMDVGLPVSILRRATRNPISNLFQRFINWVKLLFVREYQESDNA
jgi:hypothetical protein